MLLITVLDLFLLYLVSKFKAVEIDSFIYQFFKPESAICVCLQTCVKFVSSLRLCLKQKRDAMHACPQSHVDL